MNPVANAFPGDATGLPLPAGPDELGAAGPDWLTSAFRAFGALDNGNAVTRIVSCTPVSGGNSGQKALLEVEFAHPDPALDQRLFVKFSRDFADAFRDRRKHELEAEVHLAELSRHPAFPVEVARAWFADFHHASGTGLLISACVPFGSGAIEPLHPKCRDYELDDPLAYYRATISALARLAAADKAGRLAPEIDRLFPFDRVTAMADLPITLDAAGLKSAVARYAALAEAAPQLFPEAIRARAFILRLERDVLAVLAHQQTLRAFLYADADHVALQHWNTNLDNAWFWRDRDGGLNCGLLDWGMVRRMNYGYALWGGLCAAEADMLHAHCDYLIALFASQLAAHGGPALAAEAIGRHFDLSLALLGTALMIDSAALLLSRMPDLPRARSLRDPMFEADSVVHGFLQVFVNILVLWEQRDPGKSLAAIGAMK